MDPSSCMYERSTTVGKTCEDESLENEERTEAETCRPSLKIALVFFLVLVFANAALFNQSWKCPGGDKLIGNQCVPAKDRPAVEEQSPKMGREAEKPMLDAIFAAYSETFPKKSDMHLPQLFPPTARTPQELREQLYSTKESNVIRLEDVRHHSEAYEKVNRLIAKLKQGENVTIAAIGGSPTARGGFMYRLADFFRAFRFKGHVNTFNMGHGAQDGNHAAFLLDEFLPPNTDLVIWEFSINDAWGTGDVYGKLPPKEKVGLSYLSKRNFLHMLGNSPTRPAVVMVYLWPKWEVPHNYIFDHGSFPFLLGSVRMKALRNTFTEKSDKYGFTTHDHMHPSLDGNLIIGEMLKQAISMALLTQKPKLLNQSLRSRDATGSWLDPFKVSCIPGSRKQQARFQEFIDSLARETSFPRSWSVLEPISGTSFQLRNSQQFKPLLVSKTTPTRLDKRFVLHVPMCNSDQRLQLMMDPRKDLSSSRPSQYLLMSSERKPYRMVIPNRDYELLELTLSDDTGETKVLKSPSGSWDRWELDGKPVHTVHGPEAVFACGLQLGRAIKLNIPDFHVTAISICARGKMTLQWLSIIDS